MFGRSPGGPAHGARALVVPAWRTAKPAHPPALPLELPVGTSPCPFCPEQLDDPANDLGEETARVPGSGRHQAWGAMALRNRWPHTLEEEASEIVLLSDLHETDLATMAPAEARAAIGLLLERAEAQRRAGRHPLVFLNHGVNAGSSQPHPHAQVIGLPSPEPAGAAEEAALGEGACVLCGEAPADRVVAALPGASVLIPVAPTSDYDQLVVLERHGPADAGALAGGIALGLGALRGVAGPVAYNLLIHLEGHPHVHVTPRAARHSGYELAGIHPIYVPPEVAREQLARAAEAYRRTVRGLPEEGGLEDRRSHAA